jgi:lysyl-tRNA synthetase, class II
MSESTRAGSAASRPSAAGTSSAADADSAVNADGAASNGSGGSAISGGSAASNDSAGDKRRAGGKGDPASMGSAASRDGAASRDSAGSKHSGGDKHAASGKGDSPSRGGGAEQERADEEPDEKGSARAKSRKQRNWVPGVAAFVCLLIGLSDIIAVFRPAWHDKLHRINGLVPGTLTNVTVSAYVITGLLLLLLSHGLRRRKRRAWQAVVGLLSFDIVMHFIHTPRIYSAVVAIILVLSLLYFHDEFYAVGDPRTRWSALWVFGGLVVADLSIGLGYLTIGQLAGNYNFSQRVEDVFLELVGSSGPVVWVSDHRGDSYHLLTSALGLFTLMVTIYLFLRPAQPRARLGAADAERIRGLLARHGDRDSLGYFALRDDKSVIWSPSGKACVCYRVAAGVMLAAGDPIGDPEAWPGAISVFLEEAARHAWRPAVMGCSELGAEIWCREGDLAALELGDEAIVNVADFSLSGRSMRNVRQMVTRVTKNGYVAEARRVRDIPPAELKRIIRVTDSWLGGQTERGFSMALGRIGAPGDDECVIVTAHENGVLRAVLHFVPWGTDGLSLDMMRRDRNAQPGLNDFMIVESIKAAPALGIKRLSLNFAMFRAALERGERIGAGPILKSWRNLLVFMSRWFQIESLYKFNAKFSPTWEPRFFVFPGGRDAPRIAVAALEAEAFLVWPRLEVRRHARRALRRIGLASVRDGGRPRPGAGAPAGGTVPASRDSSDGGQDAPGMAVPPEGATPRTPRGMSEGGQIVSDTAVPPGGATARTPRGMPEGGQIVSDTPMPSPVADPPDAAPD